MKTMRFVELSGIAAVRPSREARRHAGRWLALIVVALGTAGRAVAASEYQTENVIIAIMDGTHYDRTFGDPEHELIPHLWNDLRPQGTYYTNFFNNSVTITLAGHSNIMTGVWHYTRNRGPLQTRPTIIHYMADELGLQPNEAWVIFGKGFYAYNPETSFPTYAGTYTPGFVSGLGETTYQQDRGVLERALRAMEEHRPRLMFVNFGVTDHTAHSGNWEYHIGAVRNNDTILYSLWRAIQDDTHYRDKTTLIITSDHGYMDPGLHDGFAEHGDASEGSRRVMLLMLGPDTRKNHVVEEPAYHIDIAPTVGELLGFQTPLALGEPLRGSLVRYHGTNRKEPRTERARQAATLEDLAKNDLVAHLAGKVLQQHPVEGGSLVPSVDSTMLLWGMLSAYDKSDDNRYLEFVERWLEKWGKSRIDSTYVGFVQSALAFRTKNKPARSRLIASARAAARDAIDEYQRARVLPDAGDRRFLLSLILASAVAELSYDEALWHRAAKLYIDHVRLVDYQRAKAHVTSGGTGAETWTSDKSGEVVEATGKVLPDVKAGEAQSYESWYLLAAAFIRGHGLPYKGENLPDLPFFQAEILHRTALMLEQLEFPGDVWDEPLDSAIAIAGIREARRRVSLRGKLYEGAESLTQFDLGKLRPESAELMMSVGRVQELVRGRITQMNYNVQYGFPRYQDFDFTVDALRLHVDQATDDLSVGAFLLALDPHRRITTDPFVPSPR